MNTNPATKYRRFDPFAGVTRAPRCWPDKALEQAPIWMSTDLRDGNQALFEPMSISKKLRLFKKLVAIGVKEIEVGFPAASSIEFDFIRLLIEENHIPSDVRIEVLTQARPELIARSFEAVRGAPIVIMHFYHAIAENFRRQVFNTDIAGVRQLAVDAARQIAEQAGQQPETEFIFQYSPETFSSTKLIVAKELVDAVTEVWQPTVAKPCIINLPSTIEINGPHIFADQIEWMHGNLARREAIVLSVHPHNDRGCAVAAAELALQAGAERVEGCLFGNGERTGNVDLITLAMNLYSHGVDPGLDFSDMADVVREYEQCTGMIVPPRHPYAGDLAFTAFSGSHQDAIHKGMQVRQSAGGIWEVPYLPIDPQDIGGDYTAIVRVNSQSGKGGVQYMLGQYFNLSLPRRHLIDFSARVQYYCEKSQQTVDREALEMLLREAYWVHQPPNFVAAQSISMLGKHQVIVSFNDNGHARQIIATANNEQAAMLAMTIGPWRVASLSWLVQSPLVNGAELLLLECHAENGQRQFRLAGGSNRAEVFGQAITSMLSSANKQLAA